MQVMHSSRSGSFFRFPQQMHFQLVVRWRSSAGVRSSMQGPPIGVTLPDGTIGIVPTQYMCIIP